MLIISDQVVPEGGKPPGLIGLKFFTLQTELLLLVTDEAALKNFINEYDRRFFVYKLELMRRKIETFKQFIY